MTTQQEQLVADKIDYLIGGGYEVNCVHEAVFSELKENEYRYLTYLVLLKSLFVI